MVIGLIITIIGLSVGTSIVTSISQSPLGDCASIDYDNSGVVDAADQATAGFKACDGAISGGFNILSIASSLIILLVIPVIYSFIQNRQN